MLQNKFITGAPTIEIIANEENKIEGKKKAHLCAIAFHAGQDRYFILIRLFPFFFFCNVSHLSSNRKQSIWHGKIAANQGSTTLVAKEC